MPIEDGLICAKLRVLFKLILVAIPEVGNVAKMFASKQGYGHLMVFFWF